MTRYPVYLEIADDGRCMAHVLELPGCIVRASSRDEALCQLPNVIRDYHAWLRCHGEPAPPEDESIEVEIAGESVGLGPFDPGNVAALSLQTASPSPTRRWSTTSASWPTLALTSWPWCVIYLTMSWIGR